MSEPRTVEFSKHYDDRDLFENFEVSDIPFPVKRIYHCYNFKKGMVRGFHYHERENKVIFCIQGAVKIVLIQGLKTLKDLDMIDVGITPTILTEHKPEGILIPSGYANAWMSLTDNASILVFSNSTTEESLNDDWRIPPDIDIAKKNHWFDVRWR